MVEIVKSLKKMLDPNYLVQNSYLFAVLSIFLTMYGPRLHMKLPQSIKNLFDNVVFRGAVLFLIAYLSSSNFQSSLVISIIFLVTMNVLHTSKVLESFEQEGFSVNGPPVASCNSYNSEAINLNGTAFYPMHDNDQIRDQRGELEQAEFEGEVDHKASVQSITQ